MLCKLCKKNEKATHSKWRCHECLEKNRIDAANAREKKKAADREGYYESMRKYNNARRLAEPEKIRAYERKYALSEKGRLTRKAHRQSNKEFYKNYKKKWDEENKHKFAGYYKKYNTTHQPRLVAHSKKRKRLREGNGGTFTHEEWLAVCEKFDNKCAWCRKDIKLTVDHVIPITKGGDNYISNIQPLCRSCNSRKNNRILDFRPFGNIILDWT